MKIIKTAKYKDKIAQNPPYYTGVDDERWDKLDADIALEFSDMKIKNIEVSPSRSSGSIDLFFPNAGENVGGGTQSVLDHWIRYNTGKIAFDYWYPPDVYARLVDAINNRL
jgi:hypothetical protein